MLNPGGFDATVRRQKEEPEERTPHSPNFVQRDKSYHQLHRTIVGDARVERSNLTKKLSVTIDFLLFPGGEFYAFAR